MSGYIDLTASADDTQRYVMVADEDFIYFVKDDPDLISTFIAEQYNRSYFAEMVVNRRTMKVTKSRYFGVDSSDYV